MKSKKTCCIILAAGLSSRMGSFKPLLPIDGKPAILFLLDKLFRAGVDQCVIVTGHNAEQIRNVCRDIPDIIWGHNPEYASTGMFESARIGFSLVPANCERILLTPADIPLIQESTICALSSAEDPLLFPSYQHRKGHPVSFSRTLLPAIMQYKGEKGLHGAFGSLGIKPAYLVTEDCFILMDMDTPEDYQELLKRLAVEQ